MVLPVQVVLALPVVVYDRHGSDSAEIVEVPQSQFLPGCGRRRDYAATSCLATVIAAIDSVHRRSQWTFLSPQREVRTVAAVHGGLVWPAWWRRWSIWTSRPRVAGTPGV